MRKTLATLYPLCLMFTLVAAPARASDLAIDGQAAVTKMLGTPLELTVTGTPGAEVVLWIDFDPGPVPLFGQPLPLGFTPSMITLLLGPIPAGGTLSIGADVPFTEALAGSTLYMLAVVADGASPPLHDYSNGLSLHFAERDVQLAGNVLGQYPHFEFVRAFNQGAPIGVAVDPSRFPQVVGQTADVYVVASKSRSAWIADGALTDLTGGAETVLFAAGSITGNTVAVDLGTLPADAGTGLGVPYDVVVDLDQNGRFDGDDLIDGFDEVEAGLYVVHDLTLPGPLAVTEVLYSGGTFLGQDLYYPTGIAGMGELPLVVVSHGNGHNYQWYDHIGMHLASYGYIVMSHQNNTVPGIETASTTTLTNTDYLLGNLGTIEGGALQGHLDGHNITWIGHSRGGEGITRAYDRIFDGTYTPVNFVLSDIRLLSSIAPTDFLGPNSANPHGVDYHLWVGGADADVSGCVGSDVTQCFHLHDRATDKRMSTSLHGVGHGDFHASTGSVATGPCLVGKTDTHTIMRGYLLPLVKHHIEGNIPAEDFLWRQYETFHPIGAPVANPCVVVDLMYREQPSERMVLDDFQTNPGTDLSSSGGAVAGTVTIAGENRLDDPDSNFTWDGDTFNGFGHGAAGDSTRGLVLEFAPPQDDVDLAFSLPAALRDLTGHGYLSFRSCQTTRHPNTTAELADLTYTLELTDGAGNFGRINIGAWGGGVEEPYQRTSCGSGAGWGNEFETIRVRLADFQTDATGLDLSDVRTLTFRFGLAWGSRFGRIGLDDIEFNKE
jgi:hypothetical protein